MKEYEVWELPVGTLEYYDDTHTYIFEGQILPSITTIMGIKFGNKYKGISKEVLERAANKGSLVHQIIQDYEEKNIENSCLELRNYKFLKKHYKWEVNRCEVPIVLFYKEKPIAAGRLDLDVIMNNLKGILDIKRTSGFDKEYVTYQTNLYRIGYKQTYGIEIDFVGGLHLREDKRKYYDLPVNENMAWSLVYDYLKKREEI